MAAEREEEERAGEEDAGGAPPLTTTAGALCAERLCDAREGFGAVVGNSRAKQALLEQVVLPLSLPADTLRRVYRGVRGGGGHVLLFGAPGTGKTSLARAAAAEAHATLFAVTPSAVLSKFHGESERFMRKIFQQAKAQAPAVLFFDEIDALACSRDDTGEVHARRVLAEMLIQMGSLSAGDKVVVVGATNRIADLDTAVIRRFHTKISVLLPTGRERVKLIAAFLADIESDLTETDVTEVAALTQDWSGADIRLLCREAAMAPLRRALSMYDEGRVTTEQLEPAAKRRKWDEKVEKTDNEDEEGEEDKEEEEECVPELAFHAARLLQNGVDGVTHADFLEAIDQMLMIHTDVLTAARQEVADETGSGHSQQTPTSTTLTPTASTDVPNLKSESAESLPHRPDGGIFPHENQRQHPPLQQHSYAIATTELLSPTAAIRRRMAP